MPHHNHSSAANHVFDRRVHIHPDADSFCRTRLRAVDQWNARVCALQLLQTLSLPPVPVDAVLVTALSPHAAQDDMPVRIELVSQWLRRRFPPGRIGVISHQVLRVKRIDRQAHRVGVVVASAVVAQVPTNAGTARQQMILPLNHLHGMPDTVHHQDVCGASILARHCSLDAGSISRPGHRAQHAMAFDVHLVVNQNLNCQHFAAPVPSLN